MESEITSGEIASAVAEAAKPAAPASPAGKPQQDGKTAAPAETGARTAESTTTATDDTTRNKGSNDPSPIPFADHDRIVNGFHKRLDAIAWANGLDRGEVERALVLMREHEKRASRTREDASAPQPDARDEKGEAFYSPKQAAALARHEAAIAVREAIAELKREYDGKLTPIERAFTEAREDGELSDQIDQARKWPGFEANLGPITAAIAAATAQGRILTLADAYIQVVAPKLSASEAEITAKAKAAWLKELNETNAAATRDDVRPSRTPSADRKKDSDKTTAEMLEEEWNSRAAAGAR